MNVAHTDDTQLNVFAEFEPKLSDGSRGSEMLFLGNIQPDLQREVRGQSEASFAALDSMNLWIETARDSLVAAIGEVDCVLLNDAELRMLTEEPNLARAAKAPMELGPRSSSPSAASTAPPSSPPRASSRSRPAAGGRPRPDRRRRQLRRRLPRLPRLRPLGRRATTRTALRRAMAYGSVMASFNVEDFGTERVRSLDESEMQARLDEFKRLTHFDPVAA